MPERILPSRSASVTPPRWMPTRTMSVAASLRSVISCAMRVSERWMPRAFRMAVDSGMAQPLEQTGIKKANLAFARVRWRNFFLHRAPWRPHRAGLKEQLDWLEGKVSGSRRLDVFVELGGLCAIWTGV